MPSLDPRERLRLLRQHIAALEGNAWVGRAASHGGRAPSPVCGGLGRGSQELPLGLALDQTLGGGLACGALHEIAPAAPVHLGAATEFALALAARASAPGRQVLWIQPDFAGAEAGRPYGPGLDLFGLPLRRLILLRVAHARDAAWAMEEALKCRALAAAILECADDALDLTMTRRLALAATDGLGLVLRHRISPAPSAALTRWEVASAPGERDRFGGLGRPALALSLVKNRRGPNGRWLVSWDHHACMFAALSRDLAQAAADGPPRLRAG